MRWAIGHPVAPPLLEGTDDDCGRRPDETILPPSTNKTLERLLQLEGLMLVKRSLQLAGPQAEVLDLDHFFR